MLWFPFCRGAAGSGQLSASHIPAGPARRLGWLRGFCLEQEGMPGTSSAMGTGRHKGELATGCMGYSGEDSPELGALLADTTFALPTSQTRRNASFGSTSEPLPLLHSHGVSQKPLDRWYHLRVTLDC